jgi:hypothetical protein
MYNVVITVPRQTDAEGNLVQHDDYKAIVIAAIGLPAISHAFASNSTSNLIHLKRELEDAADVIAAMASYEDVTITVTEVVEETP